VIRFESHSVGSGHALSMERIHASHLLTAIQIASRVIRTKIWVPVHSLLETPANSGPKQSTWFFGVFGVGGLSQAQHLSRNPHNSVQIASKVTDNQAQAIRERVARKKGHASKCMDVQSYQWDFRYLVSQEATEQQ
jgi:hypothetical protein